MLKHCTSQAADAAPFNESFLRRTHRCNPEKDWWFNVDLSWWTLEHWEGALEIGGLKCGEIQVFTCNPFGVSHPKYRPLRAFEEELGAPAHLDVATLLSTFALEMTVRLAGKRTNVFAFGDQPHEFATETLRRFNATNMGTVHRQSCGIRAPELINQLPDKDPCTRRRSWLDRYLTQGPSELDSVARLPSVRPWIPTFRRLALEQRPSGLDMK